MRRQRNRLRKRPGEPLIAVRYVDPWQEPTPEPARVKASVYKTHKIQSFSRPDPIAPLYLCHDRKLTFSIGDRVRWENPCGIGGVALFASIRGIVAHHDGSPSVVGLDVEPNDTLRDLCAQISRMLAPSPFRTPTFPGLPRPDPSPPTGLEGRGGLLLATGEAIERAIAGGFLIPFPDFPSARCA